MFCSKLNLLIYIILICVIKKYFYPYQTNCPNYNGTIRSKSQCINGLMINEFLKSDCLPKNHYLITYVIDDHN